MGSYERCAIANRDDFELSEAEIAHVRAESCTLSTILVPLPNTGSAALGRLLAKYVRASVLVWPEQISTKLLVNAVVTGAVTPLFQAVHFSAPSRVVAWAVDFVADVVGVCTDAVIPHEVRAMYDPRAIRARFSPPTALLPSAAGDRLPRVYASLPMEWGHVILASVAPDKHVDPFIIFMHACMRTTSGDVNALIEKCASAQALLEAGQSSMAAARSTFVRMCTPSGLRFLHVERFVLFAIARLLSACTAPYARAMIPRALRGDLKTVREMQRCYTRDYPHATLLAIRSWWYGVERSSVGYWHQCVLRGAECVRIVAAADALAADICKSIDKNGGIKAGLADISRSELYRIASSKRRLASIGVDAEDGNTWGALMWSPAWARARGIGITSDNAEAVHAVARLFRFTPYLDKGRVAWVQLRLFLLVLAPQLEPARVDALVTHLMQPRGNIRADVVEGVDARGIATVIASAFSIIASVRVAPIPHSVAVRQRDGLVSRYTRRLLTTPPRGAASMRVCMWCRTVLRTRPEYRTVFHANTARISTTDYSSLRVDTARTFDGAGARTSACGLDPGDPPRCTCSPGYPSFMAHVPCVGFVVAVDSMCYTICTNATCGALCEFRPGVSPVVYTSTGEPIIYCAQCLSKIAARVHALEGRDVTVGAITVSGGL